MDRKIKRHQISEQFIFSWIPQKNTIRTLLAFIVFSCMIHFLGFTLFRVAYPPVSADSNEGRVTLLDPRNDQVRLFLSRISDRIVFFDAPSEDSNSRIKLSDQSIRFVPSFAEAKPALKDTSVGAGDFKYPIPDLPVRTDLENWENPVEFSQNLKKRGVAPNTILDDYLSLVPNVPNLRFNVTVRPDGTPFGVHFADGPMDENHKILAEAIEAYLRFNPDESQVDDPGWLILGEESS